MNLKKCLVLGGNGFIGSYIVDSLSNRGFEVLAYDRFTGPERYNTTLDNVTKVKGDIMDIKQVEGALEGIDYLFHSFSSTTPFLSDANPYIDIESNLLNNVKIFDLCSKKGIKKIIYISTGGAVYGRVAEGKRVTEEDAPLPVSPYGICKLASEHYLEYFRQHNDMEYVTYRLTNPYGPRQLTKNNQGVIPSFINKIKNGETITIFGDSTISRDFIYVEDAIDMMTGSFENALQRVYNIGSGKQHTLEEIVNTINRKLNRSTAINYNKAPSTFLKKTQVSIDRYVKEFGQPKLTSLEDGVNKTIFET